MFQFLLYLKTDDIKFLEIINQGFKRTNSWNRCRSEIMINTATSQ